MIGIACRPDSLGATSIARALMLAPDAYTSLVLFFHASSWDASRMHGPWAAALKPLAYRLHGMPVLAADDVKAASEGAKMPGAQKIALKTGGKAAQIGLGRLYGAVGLIIGNCFQQFCAVVSISVRSGQKGMADWGGDGDAQRPLSSVVMAFRDAVKCAQCMGEKCALVMDRAYLSAPGLKELANSPGWISAIMRAKMNTVGYADPTGRQRKKGAKVKLAELFETKAGELRKTTVYIYGSLRRAEYYSADLLWGNGLWQKLRFVLLKPEGGSVMALACTDLGLSAEEIIEMFSLRFKIELSFKVLKQSIYAFSSHFWSKAMPKISRFGKNKDADKELEETSDPKAREAIRSALKATEAFAQISAIAMGLMQMASLSLDWSKEELRWMRTPSKKCPSEATIAEYMGRRILIDIENFSYLPIMGYIKSKQGKSLKKKAA
ncbi:MAG: transposase [Eubacteriaceae bacterium]|nr:transposase [Eubacteriaceae bacterium]